MLAVSTIATGTSPFFLAPIAHLIGMLKPVTGVSGAGRTPTDTTHFLSIETPIALE